MIKNMMSIIFPQPQHPSYSRPGRHLRWRIGYLRAQILYRPLWKLKAFCGLGPNVIWGERVSFLSPVNVVGRGHLYIGNDTLFDSSPDLYLHHTTAKLYIGDQSFINGTRFGCSLEIRIGKNCIVADARIMDTDFHSIQKNRMSSLALVQSGPVVVSNNVWIAAGSALLKGAFIGENSVIAFGSVVISPVPENKIFGGNPAKEIGNVPE